MVGHCGFQDQEVYPQAAGVFGVEFGQDDVDTLQVGEFGVDSLSKLLINVFVFHSVRKSHFEGFGVDKFPQL